MAEAGWRHDHVGLSVADLDRAVEFYERAFGFHDDDRFEVPGAKVAMMSHPAGSRIELFESPGAPADDRSDPAKALARRGYGHWALWSDDVAALYEELTAAGATGVWEPKAGRSSKVMAFVADPEGNLIELLQPLDDG